MEDVNLYFTAVTGEDLHAGAPTKGSLSIPMGVARNIAVGPKKLFLCAVVTVALVGGGGTLEVDLIDADDATLTTNMRVVRDAFLQFPAASAIGDRMYAQIPEQLYDDKTFLQEKLYLGVQVSADGSALSAGSLVIFLTTEPGVGHIYPTTNIV